MSEFEDHVLVEPHGIYVLDGPARQPVKPNVVVPARPIGDHLTDEPHLEPVARDGADQHLGESHPVSLGPIPELIEQWRRRQAWHRAEKSLTLQMKAICRRLCDGDKKEADELFKAIDQMDEKSHQHIALDACRPLLFAHGIIQSHRKLVEKRLAELAAMLPVFEWWNDQHGLGAGGLASIIGEAGDLSRFNTTGKLRKWMGMALIAGERQRKKIGDEAVIHGFVPRRRAVLWTVGESLFKTQSQRTDKETGDLLREAGPYRLIYDEYRLRDEEKNPDLTKGHHHNRAKRYMERRLLDDLWHKWREAQQH